MTVVAWIAGSVLAVAALLALVRVVRGPTVLDRAVALEVILSCCIGGIAVNGATTRDSTALAVLVVLSLLSFVGSVSIARFVSGESDE